MTGTESVVGDTEMVNSGLAVTVRVKVPVSVVEPLVPVTVTVAAPTVAVFEAVKVSVLPADPLTDAGLKAAVTPVGSPLTVKATVPVKPLMADTVMLLVAVVPCITLTPEAEMLKPAAVDDGITGYASCTNCANSVVQKVPAGSESASESVAPPASELVLAGLQFGSPVVEVTPL